MVRGHHQPRRTACPLKLQLGPRWSIDDEDWEEESEGEEDSVSRTASSSQGGHCVITSGRVGSDGWEAENRGVLKRGALRGWGCGSCHVGSVGRGYVRRLCVLECRQLFSPFRGDDGGACGLQS